MSGLESIGVKISKSSESPADGVDTRLGGWAVGVVLLGLLGGVVGWFALKGENRRRADRVLLWGLIWSGIWFAAYIAFIVLSVLALSAGASAG